MLVYRREIGDGPLFACPDCRSPLADPGHCAECGRRFAAGDGLLDFVAGDSAERSWYTDEYVHGVSADEDVEAIWASTYHAVNRVVLDAVGDLRGKDVLLVGNGTSRKELYFLTGHPHRVVFSDYSLAAVRAIRRLGVTGPIDFAAIDAMRLPFADEALDLVYGYAMVHHLADPAGFLREAARVLRPGGRAVFMDNRRSPVYQSAKTTVLLPLMRYYHRRGGVSPEDLRATLTGWHNEDELGAMMTPLGVRPFFHRSLLVHYLVTRASERLPPKRLWRAFHRSSRAQSALVRADGWLARFPLVRANQIRLVWGFTKPAA